MSHRTPQQIADHVREGMYANDRASKALGMQVLEVTPGRAVLTMTVASGFSIDLVAPARLGDVLTATCVEVSKAGRTGVYDAEVRNQRGERVAVFRGRSYTAKGRPAVPEGHR